MKLHPNQIQTAGIPEPTGGMIVGARKGMRVTWTMPGYPHGQYRGITITIDCEIDRSQHRNKQLTLEMIARAIAELPEPSE